MAKKPKYLRTPRYGRKIRLLYNTAKKKQKEKYECPHCGKKKVKRISVGLWQCQSCKAVFAGGAYQFLTPEGKTSLRLVSEKR